MYVAGTLLGMTSTGRTDTTTGHFNPQTGTSPSRVNSVKPRTGRECRRNIMLHNKENYPVFTVLDKIEPYVETKKIQPGIYFVETANYFPMRGNRWYHHTMIKYALEQNIISHSDIKFQIISSLTLKSDYFNKFINHISDKLVDEKTLF